jgi:hypothetical protein
MWQKYLDRLGGFDDRFGELGRKFGPHLDNYSSTPGIVTVLNLVRDRIILKSELNTDQDSEMLDQGWCSPRLSGSNIRVALYGPMSQHCLDDRGLVDRLPDGDKRLYDEIWRQFDVHPALYLPHLLEPDISMDALASQRKVISICTDKIMCTARICSNRDRLTELICKQKARTFPPTEVTHAKFLIVVIFLSLNFYHEPNIGLPIDVNWVHSLLMSQDSKFPTMISRYKGSFPRPIINFLGLCV